MGAGSAGTSNDSGGTDTKTPFGTASSTKTKTKFGYSKPPSKIKSFLEGGGVIGAVTKPFRDATEEVNRKFYEEKVVPAGKSKAPDYETYMKNRLAGKTDAYGNPISQSDNGGAIASSGQVVQAPEVTAPTTAEVSQAATTEAAEDSLILRKRRAKAKGRSPTIMTGVTGVNDNLTLGKPSLLGS